MAVKACEGLILCSSLPEPVTAHCMIISNHHICFSVDRTVEWQLRPVKV